MEVPEYALIMGSAVLAPFAIASVLGRLKEQPTLADPESPAADAFCAANAIAKITIGMSRPQVEAALGKPDERSENDWLYRDRGRVRFRQDKVSTIEAA